MRDDSSPPRRRLRVKMVDLKHEYEGGLDEEHAYLDLETGEIVVVTDEIRSELDEICRTIQDAEDHAAAFAEALAASDCPDWMREPLQEADAVDSGYGTRFIEVERQDSSDGYGDMEDFIETVRDERLQQRLSDAIDGRGAFRRFKDVLLSYPEERERWFAFQDAQLQQRVLNWLDAEGIEPIIDEQGR